MARLFSRETVPASEVDVETYMSQLSQELRRRLPSAEAAEIVAETRAHLDDRVEDLVAAQIPVSEAVQQATAGFGTPSVFARHIVNGMMDSRTAILSRLGFRILTGIVFAVAASLALDSGSAPWLLSYLAQGRSPESFLLSLLLIGTVVPFAIFGLAFLGKRAHPKYLIGCGAGVLVCSLAAVGLYKTVLPSGQWADRRQIPNVLRFEHSTIARAEEESRLLRLGIATYSSGPERAVPEALKLGDRFIVPTATRVVINGVSQADSAFRPIARHNASGVWYRPEKYETVASYSEARARWQISASEHLRGSILREQQSQERLRQEEWLIRHPEQFTMDCLWWDDLWSLPFTLVILLLDGLGASMGQYFALRNRRNRRKQTAGG